MKPKKGHFSANYSHIGGGKKWEDFSDFQKKWKKGGIDGLPESKEAG